MLKGRTINLRTIRQRDLPAYLDMVSDVEARGKFFPLMIPTETSVQNRFAKDGFWSDEFGMLLIVDKTDDRILGSLACFKPVFYYDAIEIGYILYDPASRGKGIMPEAVNLFSKFLFDSKPIHRLQLQIEVGNISSRRVAEKCGFTLEGTIRQAFITRGDLADLEIYSLLRSEWKDGLGAESHY